MPAPSLTDKNSTIVIIDESGTLRPVVGGILRDLGYKNVFSLKSLSEFNSYPEKHQVSWILTHPYMSDKKTVFHLLKDCLQDSKLSALRVTVFFDDSEEDLIPFAFSLGAMAYHLGPITANSIRSDLKDVIKVAREEKNDIAVAAFFLRRFLKKRQWYMDLLSLEQTILEGVDQEITQLMRAAEAYFLTGQEQPGVALLYEAVMFDGKSIAEADRLTQIYYRRSLKDCHNPVKRGTCIVIDSDEAVRKPIVDLLSKMDFDTVMEFEDGMSALEFARKFKNPDLIVTEWKIREIPGPSFVQIIRHELPPDVPIVICSSLLQESDEILLKEIGINKVISKPIQARNFIASILVALKESQYPSDLSSKEREFRLKMRGGQTAKSETILNSLLVDSSVPRGKKVLLQGEFALHEEDFHEAKRLGLQAAQIMGYGTFVLSLLGKACLQLREHEQALAYMEKASSLSPQNLERLCAIASEQAHLGQEDQAKATVDKVTKEAPTAALAKEAQLSVAVSSGEHEEATSVLGGMESSDSLISFWNSQAISHVKKGNIPQGLGIYKRALRSLPPGYSDNRSYIRYNVALAHAREGNLKKSAIYLESEATMTKSPVFKKVNSLLKKVLHALKTGEPISLQGAGEENAPEAPSKKHYMARLESPIPPGGRCLWGLYGPDQPLPKDLEPILIEGEEENQSQAS